jgi:hypothetical protein
MGAATRDHLQAETNLPAGGPVLILYGSCLSRKYRAVTLADCGVAPALLHTNWVHPIAGSYPTVRACRRLVFARLSFARAVDEMGPYCRFFSPVAPDRD